MAANTTLRVTELDFDSIKNNLKNFLRSQSQFSDFDFEGSGMNVLLDLLAYNTHYNAYYLNMIANEMFLDTSKIRQSTISHAKLINYVPESQHGAEARVNITVTPSTSEDQDTSSLTLNKYTRLIGTALDGINYPFVTINSNTSSKVDGSFNFANVIIKQGEVVTRQFLMSPTNTKRSFTIPSSNVDTSTLIVTVQESSSNTETHSYDLVEDLTEVTANSKVYFLEENEDGNYRIYFGDDVIGKKPKNDNIIICTYLDTVGSVANKINVFTLASNVGPFNDNIITSSWGPSYSGSERESIEQVKFRAPYFYSTQNRAVTVNDYETLITKDYPNIDSATVWGGEENDPPIYGKVFLSLKPKDNYFLTNLEKESIKTSLVENRNVLTVTPEIVDPEYTYVLVRGTVNYDPTLTSMTADQIKTFVVAAIEDYRDQNLGSFKEVFQKSKLQKYIEDAEKSITSSDIKILLQKRIPLTLNQIKNYNIEFEIPIRKGDFSNSLYSFPSITVLDVNFVERKIFFEEVPSINSGIDSVEITNGGINYSTVPIVTITGDGTGATAVARIYGGRVVGIDITNKGINYSRASVAISGESGTGVYVKPILESRISTLRTYYIKENGEKSFVNLNAGTIDYESGKIVLQSLIPTAVESNDYYEINELTINIPTDKEIVISQRNKIVDLDINDPFAVQIQVVPET